MDNIWVKYHYVKSLINRPHFAILSLSMWCIIKKEHIDTIEVSWLVQRNYMYWGSIVDVLYTCTCEEFHRKMGYIHFGEFEI